MNNKRIAQLHRNLSVTHTLIADEFMKGADPEIIIIPPTPVPEPPSGNKIPVRIFFYGMSHSYKEPVDIQINGVWYNFSQSMDVKFKINQAVGTIIEVDAPITRIELREEQIRFPHLNEAGFGFTNIKYGAVPAHDNLLEMSEAKWSSWEHGKANHTAHWGDLGRSTPDPNFFRISVPRSFNDTEKFAIYVSGYRENKP